MRAAERFIGFFLASLLAAGAAVPAAAHTDREVRLETRFDSDRVVVRSGGERYLEIEVTAPDSVGAAGGDRPPLNLALVIDKSGSMAEAGKMAYVKEAAGGMIDRLRYGDRFSIVAYDDDVHVLLPSEALEDRFRAAAVVEGLRPSGSTNLGGGLVEGYEQVRRHLRRQGVNRVLLLSDGLANRGLTDPARLSRLAGREGDRGVSLSTFGVGLHFNEDLLASLAEGGRGTYYYIDRPDRIAEILAREFSLAEEVVALDVVITIEVREGFAVDDVLGYEWRREGKRCRVRLGDMSAGEKRRIMVRLAIPERGAGEYSLGEVGAAYRLRGTGTEMASSRELRLSYVGDEDAVERHRDMEVSERAAVYEANAARYEAAKRIDRGDVEGARGILVESRRRLEASPVQSSAVRDEISETEAYGAAAARPMSAEEKEAVQKDVKYRSYQVLQSK